MALLFSLGGQWPALAAAEELDPQLAFRQQYERAGRLYAAKDYTSAIPALQAAYALQPIPQLLFNIAQAYRRLEQWSSARVYFEMYRAIIRQTTPEKAANVESTILEMREREVAEKTPQVIEKTRTLVVKEEKPLPRWLRPLGAVGGVAGLSLAATGGAFLGLDGQCVAPAMAPSLQCQQVYDSKTLGTTLTAVGAGLFVVGAITFGLSLRKPARPKRTMVDELPEFEQLQKPSTPASGEPAPAGWNHDGTPGLEPPPTGWGVDGSRTTR